MYCNQRVAGINFQILRQPTDTFLNPNFPSPYFGLIVLNRVLQCIPHRDIEVVTKKLSDFWVKTYSLTKYLIVMTLTNRCVYLNIIT